MKIKLISLSVYLFAVLVGVASAAYSKGLPWDGDAGTGSILLMSDIHLDPFANPDLVKKLIDAPVEQWESLFESSPADAFAPYGKDTNYPLMVSALDEARKKGPYDYAIVTGDYLVHESRKLFEPFGGKDEQAYEDFVIKTEVFVSREVQKRLAGTPVCFSLGNNDSECGDYMMAAHTKFLAVLSTEWETLKGHGEAQKTMADAGYYEIAHPTLAGTELVVLNDIYWSNHYHADSCYSQPNDKAGDKEMTWLGSRLAAAKKKNKKVILVMHIPTQLDIYGTLKAMMLNMGLQLFWDKKYEKAYVQLMRDYEGTVVFAFAGHTHMDDYRVLSDDQGKPFLVTHICPAVSPIRMNNSSFEVMAYDKSTGGMKDQAVFYLTNLASAKGANGQWDLEYDFDQTYGVTVYDAPTLKTLTESMDTNGDLLSQFAKYYIVSASEGIPPDAWKKVNDLRLSSTSKELEESSW